MTTRTKLGNAARAANTASAFASAGPRRDLSQAGDAIGQSIGETF